MAIMQTVATFKFWPMPPYDYALMAIIGFIIGGLLVFLWQWRERQSHKKEIKRLTETCDKWEKIVEKQSDELEQKKEENDKLQAAFDDQKDYTKKALKQLAYLYEILFKKGLLTSVDMEWIRDSDKEMVMSSFKRRKDDEK